mmetsp:Transcript_18356/g.42339  ORF Transcript_18356/g.42339 Transcript_18356/m.42339 type:complete len:501 (+) Transcript_18356:122-1624(+)|eukprot:CAMPEP_0197186794 /NCGR_PEP_ID=MMETSP1423-20130617/14621_1 /TAXON_ID=476441 /ORGANISM="Pseudo-nitzschia heimii, Strain UNC1101" /LENGTH=500 /DNA_ID=CAMNT_0042638201 /DNA_START=12 /DNA_END=1514 /DNA_ORIENTATION=-
MRFISGDECGLLKEVIPELGRKKKDPNALIQPYSAMIDVTKEGICRIDPKESQKRERGIIDMIWINEGHENKDDEENSSSFGVLRRNGSVDVWTSNIEKQKSFGRYTLNLSTPKSIFGTKDCARPLGLGYFNKEHRLCAGDVLGNIAVLNCQENKCEVVQTYNSYTANKIGKTISYTPGKFQNVQVATAIAFDTNHARAAIGGREREVCLTDISTGKLVFKTKNMPPDSQTLLQQPVWPTAIKFLNDDSNVMAVGTAYKQVRLYDVRETSKTRRPTSLTPEGLLEYRVTCLCQIDDNELAVGDASGDIFAIDLRRLGRKSKGSANRDLPRFPGPAGSVRQLEKHPTLPRMTAVGLDRMLRVYDTNTRKQLDCVYLKQRLNSVLVHRNYNWDSSEDASVVSNDDAYMDDVEFDQDDVVEDYVNSDDSDDDSSIDSQSEAEKSSESDALENNSPDESFDDNDDSDASDDSNSEDESLDESDSGSDVEEEEKRVSSSKRRRHK